MSVSPVRVTVTGAAGQIGYSLLFRIASGQMLGPKQPVILQLLEVTPALNALRGVAMELDDCAFPLLAGIVPTDDADIAFGDSDYALLVGAMPRKAGMERADLLSANGGIFKPQGEAIARSAGKDIKVLVVGNPANTNALIAMNNAKGVDPRQFTAMTRLDHNRAITQVAQKLGAAVTDVKRMTIWGNHSTTQYPDLFNCRVAGKNAARAINDRKWIDTENIPTVAKRGAAIIEARGLSSAASAANAAIDHMHDWALGTTRNDWVSMAVCSDGSYGVPEGLISSFPCVCKDGKWEIVQNLTISPFSRKKIDASVAELEEERQAVRELGLILSEVAPSAGRDPRVHYAWVVAAVTFVTLLVASGMRAAPGVLIGPLHDAFGWGTADVGLAVSVNVLLFGFTGPFAAALLGRFGLRRVVPAAMAVVALGTGLSATVTARWQLVLYWGVLVGIGTGCMAAVLAATVANRWFVARRGLVTGGLMAAGASGQVVFFQVLTRLTASGHWQRVPLVVSACAVVAVVPTALLLRDKPEDKGLRAYGAPPDHRTPPPTANPVRAAFSGLRLVSSSGAFWVLFGSFFVCGISTNGLVQTHFLEAAHDHGIARTAAATLVSLIGLFDIVGTLASGWLTDRYDPRKLLFAYYGLRGLSLLLLQPALESGHAPLWLFIGFYGLDWVATVPPTVALCRELCGAEWATVAYGWVFAGHQLGASAAAWGAGEIRDRTGSYQLSFLIAAACCLVASFGVLRIGNGNRDAVVDLTTASVPA